MIIRIFATSVPTKPLNDAQMRGAFFVYIRSLSKYANGKITALHTALSFKVEVMIYCPYPVQCEPGISFIFECQRVILLSKSVFLSFLPKEAQKSGKAH